MKKQKNISLLKELVNNNVMKCAELRTRGVQAYNIAEGEEFAVLVAYTKHGGRYYFVDRDGRRFLASRYDRAEFVAGEMLEVIANESAAAMHAADQVEAVGSVLVCADLLPLFFEECDRRKINVTSTAAGVDDLGRMLTRYDIVKQSDSDSNAAQSNEGEPTAAEPVTLVQKVTKTFNFYVMEGLARVAFFVSLVVVFALSFAVMFACLPLVFASLNALGITGIARLLFAFLVVFGPVVEMVINIEANALAVVDRIFPGRFPSHLPFEIFSFWGRMCRA